MRRLSLTAGFLLVASCGGEELVLIEDFASRSPRVRCEPLAGPDPAPVAVTALRAASDSTLLLVDGPGREVVLLDGNAARTAAVRFSPDGPRGVALLADAALSADSLLVLSDAGRPRLRAFDMRGRELWTLPLDFPPQRLAFAGGRLFFSTAGMDRRAPALLFEVRDGRVTPTRIPLVGHGDGIARLFLNDVALQGYGDGSLVVAHRFVWPRAWRMDADDRTQRMSVPIARGVKGDIGHLPEIPFREEDVARIAVPVIASAGDPRTGDLLYLTRSGRRRDGRSEKAIVRADGHLAYLASRRLDVNAVALAYLPVDPQRAIVVDSDASWYRCEAP